MEIITEKAVPNFSNYKANIYGEIWNVKTGKKLNGTYKNGYIKCSMTNDSGVKKYCLAHRIIAKTFIPNPEGKPQVDHINGVKDDNRVANLRWATSKENSNNPITLVKIQGENHPNYGINLSEETKVKIRNKHVGKKLSDETIEKIRASSTGRHHTEETKNKLSSLLKGRPSKLKGTKREKDTCDKIRDALKGKPKTKEHKENLSKSRKGNTYRAKPVVCDGAIIANSAKEASNILNIKYSTLVSWLNNTKRMTKEWSDRGLKYEKQY